MPIARALAAALVTCAVGLTACGGLSENAVIVRIGGAAITKATVDHWTRVIEHGGPVSGFRGAPRHGSARQRALALLISCHWLIGEAALQGLPVSGAVIDEALTQREQGSEFRKRLRATGQTLADTRLELGAEIAVEAVREELASRAGQFTQRDVAEYFHKNPSRFRSLEVRMTDLIESLPSQSAAMALVRRIGTGLRFAKRAIHEPVTRTPGYMETPEKARLVNAIFAARPGVVSRPMPLSGAWTVFVVRRVIPPHFQALATIQGDVAKP